MQLLLLYTLSGWDDIAAVLTHVDSFPLFTKGRDEVLLKSFSTCGFVIFKRQSARISARDWEVLLLVWEWTDVKYVVFLAKQVSESESVYQGNDTRGGADVLGC